MVPSAIPPTRIGSCPYFHRQTEVPMFSYREHRGQLSAGCGIPMPTIVAALMHLNQFVLNHQVMASSGMIRMFFAKVTNPGRNLR